MAAQRKQGEPLFFPDHSSLNLSCSDILAATFLRETIPKWRQERQRLYEKSWIDADPFIFFLFQILSRTATYGLPNFQRNRLPMAGKCDRNEIKDQLNTFIYNFGFGYVVE